MLSRAHAHVWAGDSIDRASESCRAPTHTPASALLAIAYATQECRLLDDVPVLDRPLHTSAGANTVGCCDGQTLVRALGLTHDKTPCATTLYHVLRQLDEPLVEAILGTWAASVLTALSPTIGAPEAMAIEGQTLRGSRKQGAPATHLLSGLSHRLGLT